MIDLSCQKFIKANGMLQEGTVKSLPEGNLACFFLFHCVSPILEKEDVHEKIIEDTICNAMVHADSINCKSLSIPILKSGK